MKIKIKMLCAAIAAIMAFSTGCTAKNNNQSSDGSSSIDPPAPTMDINTFAKKLMSTPYSDATLSEKGYGLNDAAATGVDKDALDKTVLYPIVNNEDFDGEVITFGTFQSENEEPFEKLNEIFKKAKEYNDSGKKVKINIDEDITVSQKDSKDLYYTFVLDGYNGLYIEGCSNTISLSYENLNWRGFLNITNSNDVHIANLKVDYEVPSCLNGKITATDSKNKTVTFSISEEFNELVERAKAANATIKSYLEFSSATNSARQNGNYVASSGEISSYTVSGSRDDGYSMTVKFAEGYDFKDVYLNDYALVQFSMYSYNGFGFGSCKNVYVENLTLYTAPGMGLVASHTENIFINRYKLVLKEGSQRKMTATADGSHFDACLGEVKITNSIFENSHDDSLNIKSGYYYTFSDYSIANKTITISKKTAAIPEPKAGEKIEVYSADDLSFKASFTVESVSGTSASYVIKVKETLITLGIDKWGKCVATNVSLSAKFTFTNNIVRNKRNRGLLVQVRNATIENNTFMNVAHGSLQIASVADVFNEATLPKNITVKNNKFINNNYMFGLYGDISVFAQGNEVAPPNTITGITIENNFITANGNAAIYLGGVGSSNVSNNLFYNVSRTVQNEIYCCVSELTNCKDIKFSNNYNHNDLDQEGFGGIITAGLTDSSTITLDKNTNLSFKTEDGEVSTFEVNKIDASGITIDGNIAEWNKLGTDIKMDGSSLATGDAITPDQYNDVFKVNTAKIAWSDSGLYFVFDVYDNKADFKLTNNYWTGDCVELFFTTVLNMPNADFKLIKEYGDTIQAAFAPTWAPNFTVPEARSTTSLVESSSKWQVKLLAKKDGYSGEIFIPFTALNNTEKYIKEGGKLAMAIVFADNDRDDLGRKRVQVSNVPHFVEAYKTKTVKMPLYAFI